MCGKNHLIVVCHSTKPEKKRIMKFMKRSPSAYTHVEHLIECGYSDSMERVEFCPGSRNLSKTLLLPDLRIDNERMAKSLKLLGINAPTS